VVETTAADFYPVTSGGSSWPLQVYDEHIYWREIIIESPDRFFAVVRRTPLEPGQSEPILKLFVGRIEYFTTILTDDGEATAVLPPIFLVTDDAIFWHDPENDNAIMRLELR
jgi:hypothetical protein